MEFTERELALVGGVIANDPSLVVAALDQLAANAERFSDELKARGWASAPDFRRRAALAREMSEGISRLFDGAKA